MCSNQMDSYNGHLEYGARRADLALYIQLANLR